MSDQVASGFTHPTEVLTEHLRSHHRTTEQCYVLRCAEGCCEHEDECPLVDIEVCSACMMHAFEVSDERIPDEALAKNCAVLLAIESLDAVGGWRIKATP